MFVTWRTRTSRSLIAVASSRTICGLARMLRTCGTDAVEMGRLTAPNRNRGLLGTQTLSTDQEIDSGARTILTLQVGVIGLGGYRAGVEAMRPSEASRAFPERRPDGQPCHRGQSHPAPDQGAGRRNLAGPCPQPERRQHDLGDQE